MNEEKPKALMLWIPAKLHRAFKKRLNSITTSFSLNSITTSFSLKRMGFFQLT